MAAWEPWFSQLLAITSAKYYKKASAKINKPIKVSAQVDTGSKSGQPCY